MRSLLEGRSQILLAYASAIILLIATSFVSPGFLSESNLRLTVILAAFIGIVSIGQTFVVIGAGIDLSIPWVLNCAAVTMAMLAGGQDGNLAWVVPLVLFGGMAVGIFNGIGVAIAGVPPIIMTLATNVILQGVILVFTGGRPTPPTPEFITYLAVGRIGPVPVLGLIWLVLAVVATFVLSRTVFGRQLYAVGDNAEVARYSGVPTVRTTIATYVISGFTAALAGILLTGYSGQAYLGMGDAYLFTSVAAVAIGGASILGGTGTYVGTVAGALILTILNGLLPALNLSSGALQVVYGLVILVTVAASGETVQRLGQVLFRKRSRPQGGE
ncbi:ABC transporter permease [Hoeflea sp. G2-23]|uniref:ABC transporter permease n=1 Tax=Hoeflea algicola TaxID=2983763 RepID=A0ABT3ZEJ7_9HYPH|nr:ABC transporter permease [Hoeflea algicola]MCY0150178.1 ABC transporter permease [Hoeflea algicola]